MKEKHDKDDNKELIHKVGTRMYYFIILSCRETLFVEIKEVKIEKRMY